MAVYSVYGIPVTVTKAEMRAVEGKIGEELWLEIHYEGETERSWVNAWQVKADRGIPEIVSVAKQCDPYIRFP